MDDVKFILRLRKATNDKIIKAAEESQVRQTRTRQAYLENVIENHVKELPT